MGAAAPSGLGGMIEAGGPIIWLLIALSLLSLTVIMAKTLQLAQASGGTARRDAALALWAQRDREAALERVSGGTNPVDRILAHGMAALRDGLRGAPLQAELMRRGNEEAARLTAWLRLLELIAMISPLLGLLGTVLGMIQSFQELEMAQGSANASVLAGGIWVALLTTAAGLLVAIPAAAGATLLAGQAERTVQRIENAAGQLLLIENGGRLPTGPAAAMPLGPAPA